MNIFANQYGVYLLALVPVLLALLPFHLHGRRRRNRLWGGELMKSFSSPQERKLRALRLLLLALAMALTFLAFARPQWGDVERKAALSDLDVVVLFDVSRSMSVEDVRPSRFERAKMEVRSLIARLEGARIGIVAFSGMPLILSPLTDDKGALNLLFEIADSNLIPVEGTDLGKGVEEALRLFPYEEDRSRVMIVFSDGEDMGMGAFKSAGAAQSLDVKIFSVGIGTEGGGIVKDRKGGAVTDPDTGEPARSRLDPRKLQHIANVTDGRYFEITNESQNINSLYEELGRIKKREYATKQREKREDQFPIFAGAAFLAFFATALLPRRKKEAAP